ncbi:hypothetical protein [Sinorhizobium meliloti]|uniref:hypothetical protein n=1 Tax=Rhizobium meliloti TaxID=382 RepID=UPI000FDABE50|nr:hypothetical protein [Sinorhizobium meliloti]RVL05651.1 hypothetical protein CN152_03355 [Sinorhizobium meliloti]RVN49955.1 hypothetical protein CN113_06940 [Sinorhizobium meliloti]
MSDIEHPDDIVLDPLRHASVAGMRYNGYRWVTADSLDTIRAVDPPERGEYFVGISRRTPSSKPLPRRFKNRARGPAKHFSPSSDN